MIARESSRRPPGIASFFTLVWLIKYGLALSAFLVYLPFTMYSGMPLRGMFGNLFSELSCSW